MLYTFKYIIANEGIDTAKSYPFQGKVPYNIITAKNLCYKPSSTSSNKAAYMMTITLVLKYLEWFASSKGVRVTSWGP